MQAMDELLNKIECLRNEMNRLARLNGITHPSVIESSQRLDRALNEYERLKIQGSMLKTG